MKPTKVAASLAAFAVLCAAPAVTHGQMPSAASVPAESTTTTESAPAPAESTAPAESAPAPGAGTSGAPSFLELADHLRDIGSYSECAVEALRHAYQHPDARQVAFDRAALCLSLAGRFEDARRLMLTVRAAGGELDGAGRLQLCLAEVFLPGLEAPACPKVAGSTSPDRLDALAHHTLSMRALHAGKWQEARALIELGPRAPADPTLAGWRKQDLELLGRYDRLPRRSPWIAGGLAMLFPGLGRVYLGRWQDAIMSVLLIGAAGGLAAHGFYQDGTSSVRGWLLGTTAVAFYIGDIYGSAVGALVQRRTAEDQLLHDIDHEHRRRLGP